MTRLVLGLVLAGGLARAEDGGVSSFGIVEMRRGAVVLPDERIVTLGPGLCLDEATSVARARELAELRVEVQEWRRRTLAAPVCSPQPSTIGASVVGALAVLAASLVPLFLPR